MAQRGLRLQSVSEIKGRSRCASWGHMNDPCVVGGRDTHPVEGLHQEVLWWRARWMDSFAGHCGGRQVHADHLKGYLYAGLARIYYNMALNIRYADELAGWITARIRTRRPLSVQAPFSSWTRVPTSSTLSPVQLAYVPSFVYRIALMLISSTILYAWVMWTVHTLPRGSNPDERDGSL